MARKENISTLPTPSKDCIEPKPGSWSEERRGKNVFCKLCFIYSQYITYKRDVSEYVMEYKGNIYL